MEVASAYVTLMPSAKGFGKRTESLMNGELGSTGEKQGRGIGSRLASGMGKTLKVGAVGVAAAAGGLAATALAKGFSRLQGIEQAQAKLTGLGHSTKSVTRIMENATAAVTGTAFGLDAAATVAASAVAAGVKPGRDLERTLTLVGDAATIAGTDMASMGAIWNKVAASDMIQGDVLAQLGDQGIPILQLLGQEMGVAATEVRKMASRGEIDFATFQNAMEKGLGGAAQESGKTFAGSLANVNAALGRLGARVLGGVFSKMPGIFQGLSTNLDKLGPVADRVGQALGTGFAMVGQFVTQAAAAVAPFVSQIVAAFGEGGGIGGVLATLQPVLATAAATFTGVVLPAVTSFGQYVAGALVPVLSQVWQIISGQVVPILASLGQFLYGTVYPAVVGVATAIGSNLRPVFDAIVGVIRGTVLPAVSNLLAKLREWGPTIAVVVGAVVKIIGKVLEFASAILGKVLPPVIRFAGFMAGGVVSAIVGTIGVIAQLIASSIDMGKAFVERVKDVAKFVTGLKQKFDEAMRFVATIPGKIASALGDLATIFYNKGKEALSGLARGLADATGLSKVTGAIGNVASKIGGFFHGSPVKEGPLKSWNNGGAGKRLMQSLIDGIEESQPKVANAMQKIVDAIDSKFEQLGSLRDRAAQFGQSIADAFASSDIFSATTGSALAAGLNEQAHVFANATKAMKQLRKMGAGKGFLSELMASGNLGLIQSLAAGPRQDLMAAQNQYRLQQQWGNALSQSAGSLNASKEIRAVQVEIREMRKELRGVVARQIGSEVGKALDGTARTAAAKGRR